MQDLTIASVQSNLVWEDTQANLAAFDKKLQKLDRSFDLLILPEMFNTGFSINPGHIAEKPDGRTFAWMQQKAVALNATVTGSVLVEEAGKYYNRMFWVRPDGTFDAYDKRHLFRLGKEHKVFTAGQKRVIVNIKGWKVLLQVCYDLRFPVWSKNRFINGAYEYDLIIYVANWPAVRSYAWRHLLIARAIENQACVAGVNRVGEDGNHMIHSGDSMIINHLGDVVSQAPAHEETIITATLSYQSMKDFRKRFTVGLDWDEFKVKI